MKKTLWMLGVAVAALTSCTESEVLDVPESKMIGFDTFVDKPTRALGSDVNTANLNGFYVYGAYGTGAIDVINNFTVVDNDYLNGLKVYKDGSDWKYDYQPWIANNIFRFAAYVDGETDANNTVTKGKLNDVTFIPKLEQEKLTAYGVDNGNLGSWGLEFENYEVSNKDLLVSVPFSVDPGNLSVAPAKVNVTFKHMLAKVVFEFSKSGITTEKLSIEPFSFDAKYIGDCLVHFGEKPDPNSVGGRLTDPHIHWKSEDIEKTYEVFPKEGENNQSWNTGTISQEFYVLPQSNENLVLTNFKIYVHKGSGEEVVKTFVMNNVSLKITDHTQWLPGQIYRYYADVTPGAYNIVFSASVDSWSDTANRDQNISTTPTPNP